MQPPECISTRRIGIVSEMIFVPGGEFLMGSASFYPEERPVHTAKVEDFFLAECAVTNAEFAEFVGETGYLTIAERPLSKQQFPKLPEAERAPGSLVFHATAGPVDLSDWRQWWGWVPGANWRHPFGPESDLTDRADHPVVQIAYPDALAYAEWAGARLPTEAEWERAARSGHAQRDYAWGDELHPGGAVLANTWQGRFPYENTGANGYHGTAPVGSFPANDYGLFDMIGNVWEWTSSRWTPDHREAATARSVAASVGTSGCGCGPSSDSAQGRVTKGGSHLCSPDYCKRYRPAARSSQTEDSATTHLGFRIARSL